MSLRILFFITLFVDIVVLIAAETANAFFVRAHGAGNNIVVRRLADLVAIGVTISILHQQSLIDLFHFSRPHRELISSLSGIFSAEIFSVICLLAMDENSVRASIRIISWILGGMMLLTVERAFLTRMVKKWRKVGRIDYKIAVLGSAPAAQAFSERVTLNEDFPILVVGFYTSRWVDPPAFETQAGPLAFRGNLDILLLDSRRHAIDAVVLTQSELSKIDSTEASSILEQCASDIYLLPDMHDPVSKDGRLRLLGTYPVIAINEIPLQGWRVVAKHAFDKVVAAALLVSMAPILGIVATLIRLDSPGPILFRQLRTGHNNTLFSMLKFRTMYHHMADRQASAQTSQGDKRVTNIGRVLRKLSIDELPQLINVLRGDMSLVGPRPHAPGTAVNGVRLDDLVAGYARRHLVRPGLTGLAQVNGSRGCMTRPEHAVQRLRYDLEYIEHWSFRLDIKIMFLTLVREIVSRNAY